MGHYSATLGFDTADADVRLQKKIDGYKGTGPGKKRDTHSCRRLHKKFEALSKRN